MTNNKKELRVGRDWENSVLFGEYAVKQSQKFLIKEGQIIDISINRNIIGKIKIIQTKDIDENTKHTLTKKYNWFPEPGTKDDWYVYFTYELL
jgi:hypothetical protein